MRIAYLTPYYYPSVGGIERFCEGIATRMAQADNEVHIITQTIKDEKDNEEVNGIKIHRIKPIFRYSKSLITPNIKQKIKEISPAIIHIQGPAPGMEDFVAKDTGTKIIMTCHTDLTLNDTVIYKTLATLYRTFVFPRVVSKLDGIVLLSEVFKYHSAFSKLFTKIPQDKISIIPNAVDLEIFSPGNKTKMEYKKDLNIDSKFFGTFVASMEPKHTYKGVEYLLHAISLIKDDVDITFSLVGEGELKQRYIEIANALGISDRVRFPGHGNNEILVKHYRAADIFALPSTSTAETQGIVMIEAMGCGTPVITTKIHGPMEMVYEGYNGYVVNPRDSEDLAKAIKKILSDDVKLRQMQINARREAEAKYSWHKVSKQYLEIYKGKKAYKENK
jgi:glycosyltransferase involved in cell wall biosynthesis